MGAGDFSGQQELDRGARRSSPIGTASPASRTIASSKADGHMCAIALGSGCFVILLASSQRP